MTNGNLNGNERSNKLQAIHPTIGPWPHANQRIRCEEVVLARLGIGHTRLTPALLKMNSHCAVICVTNDSQ